MGNTTTSASTPRPARRSSAASPPSGIVLALLAGVLVGALGPRAFGPHDRRANAPFAYAPPPGYEPASDAASRALQGTVQGAERVWLRRAPPLAETPKYRANVSLVHTPKRAPLDEDALASLVAGMPTVFAASGVTWREARHGVHVRADRARASFIEGDATNGAGLDYRVLQIAFPDDAGTSIVTASFPIEDAAREEEAFEETIDAAKGVAFVAPDPPWWSYVAWGAAAALLTYLAMGLRVRVATPVPAGAASERP